MYKKIDDLNINYITYGNPAGLDVVMLHGWGQNIAMMNPLGRLLEKDYHITVIDLPGFGDSEEPKSIYTVYDYTIAINKLLKSLKIDNPIMVGHSFGGKISLLYASKYKTKKLVLFGSPYDIEIKKISIKTRILKFAKKIPFISKLENIAKKHIGSVDYRNASVMMRKILTSTVNLSIKDELSKIKAPTLIIWGTNDQAVDIKYAYNLEKFINNAGLVVYENCSHYAYLERLNQTASVLKSFFESGE